MIARKGLTESNKMLYWIVIVLPFIIVLTGIVILAVFNVREAVGGVLPGTEEMIIETRLLYSPNCLAYKDTTTGRVYTGVIDLDKFSVETLTNCVHYEKVTDYALRLELFYTKDDGEDEYADSITTPNWDLKHHGSFKLKSFPVQVQGKGPGRLTFIYR